MNAEQTAALEAAAREWASEEPHGTTAEILDSGVYDDGVREVLGLDGGIYDDDVLKVLGLGDGDEIPSEAWDIIRRAYREAFPA